MAKVRLVDVAREAGVSVGAASDALAGKNRIPEETRRRVRETAERLGYVPNPVARAMTGGRLPLVALVITTMRREVEYTAYRAYWAEIIGAATLAFHERGYGIVVLPGLEGAVANLPYAGVVLLDLVEGDRDLMKAFELGIPVAADSMLDDERLVIGIDVAYGHSVPLVMEHFVANGSKRPALLRPDVDAAFSTAMRDRYQQWCADRGIEPVAAAAEATGENLHLVLADLLDAGADAVYSAMPPDPMLKVLKDVLASRSLELGKDVKLVIQEEDLHGDLAKQGVSTVHFSAMKFVHEIANRLVAAIEAGEPEHSRIIAPFDLAVHDSSR